MAHSGTIRRSTAAGGGQRWADGAPNLGATSVAEIYVQPRVELESAAGLFVRSLSSAPPPPPSPRNQGNSTMASTALYLCALVAHASALTLHAPARAPFALGRRTAALRMALPSAVEEFVPENVASDAAQMKQVDELWKVCAWHARDVHVACTWHAPGVASRTPTHTHAHTTFCAWCAPGVVHGARCKCVACARKLSRPVHGRYCYPGPIVSALTPPAYQVISRLYQSDDAALQALRQNSQILLPVYSSPTLLQVRNPVQHGLQPCAARPATLRRDSLRPYVH